MYHHRLDTMAGNELWNFLIFNKSNFNTTLETSSSVLVVLHHIWNSFRILI
jgi:hypothetical protein